MVLYQEGDTRAFDLLYRRHSGKVYGFIKNRISDSGLVEDIFQSVFVKLHKSRNQFDSSLKFKAWLFTICRTVLADAFRERPKIETVPLEEASDIEAPRAGEMALWGLEPLTELPEAQRRAVELRYIEELSFDEIARRLETSPDNVRQLVSRGVRSLKALLNGKRIEK